MTTQYTSILKLALPVQGELSGTWGDVVNDNITSMVEEAVAGRAVINSWTTNSHTLTTADGTTSESRCAMLEFTDTGTALTGAATVVCPSASKLYVCKNDAGQQVTIKTAAGTGVAIPDGETMFVFCDGTNVEQCETNFNSLSFNGYTLNFGGAVTTAGAFTTSGAYALTLTTTGATNVTLPTTGTLATLDGTETFTNKTFTSPTITSPTLTGTISATDLNISGNTTIGDAAADTLTINGTVTSNLIFTDDTYDIGAVGATRPRNLYLSGNATIGGTVTLSGGIDVTGALGVDGNFDVNTDKFTVASATGNTVVAGTLGVTGATTATGGLSVDTISEVTAAGGVTIDSLLIKDVSVGTAAASGTDTAGTAVTIKGGASTGTGAGGSLIFQTTPAGSTGSSVNTQVTALTIDGEGDVTFANDVTVTGRISPTGLTVDSGTLYVDDTNNRVGIGNSTGSAASYPLHLKDNRDNIMMVESTDADVRLILKDNTSNAADNYIGQIGDKMRFVTNATESMRITGAARIGVNTAADPNGTYQMEIKQDTAGGSENLLLSNGDNTAGTAQKTRLDFGLARNSGTMKPEAGRISVAREQDWTADDATIDSSMTFSVFQNNAAVDALYIKSSGYVGVNTPSLPTNRLEVRGDPGEGIRLNETGATYHDITFTSDDLVINVDSKGDGVSKFIINNDGNRALTIHTGDQTVIGQATDTHSISGGVRQLTVEGVSGVTSSMAVIRNQNNAEGPNFTFGKSRGTTTGSNTTAIDGDTLGEIRWSAADGTDMDGEAARIFAQAAGGVSTGDTPGRIVFATTPNNSVTPVNRMRIDDTGRVSMGAASDLSDAAYGSNPETLMLADQGNGGGLRIRGLSPYLAFDVTGASPHSRIYHDGQDLKTYTGDPTSAGNLGLVVRGANAHVLVGSDTEPATTSGFGEGLNVVGDSTASAIGVTRYTTGGGSAPYLRLAKANGSAGSPSATLNNDYLGYLQWFGTHDGSDFGGGAGIYARADANYTATSRSGHLEILTTAAGAASPVERVRINGSDNPVMNIYAGQNGAHFALYNGGTKRFNIAVEASGTDSIYFANSTGGISNSIFMFAGTGLLSNVAGDSRAFTRASQGTTLREPGESLSVTRNSATPFEVNRGVNDGALVNFFGQGVVEGSISVSGTTVSYNGGHLARWSQLTDGSKDTSLLKGTVLTNLDQMAVWGDEPNEQLNCMAVSSVEGDPNVAGVFVSWDEETYDPDDNVPDTNDMNVAMTGDMIIRIAQGTTVARGDLLMSAGDGTAKPQGDDIVRGKTVAKVTSTHVTCTYDDGSYCVPCVLMAC